MGRLTKRGAISQRDIEKLLVYSNENQFGPNNAYFKLQEYEDLEEQGLLLRLPCKVGDDIYLCAREVLQCKVHGISLSKIGVLIEIRYNGENKLLDGFRTRIRLENLGDTAHLTKAEAEKKLAEMGSK